MATSNDGSAGGGFPSLTMGNAPVLKIDHSDVAGSFRSWLDLFIIHQKMKRLEMGVELIYGEDEKGKPVVVDRKDRFGDEAQLLSLLQCIGEDGRRTLRALGYNIETGGGSCGDVMALLRRHYEREESMYVKAQKFMNAQQGAGESDCDFLLRVEDLSRQQEIGDSTRENAIRERFALCVAVKGLRNVKIRQELMAKPDLTWAKLANTLKARARASEASVALGESSQSSSPSTKVKSEPSVDECRIEYSGARSGRPRDRSWERSVKFDTPNRGHEYRSDSRERRRYSSPSRRYSSPDRRYNSPGRDNHSYRGYENYNKPRADSPYARPPTSDKYCAKCGPGDHNTNNCQRTRCYNCGDYGHLSNACNKPSVCWICKQPDHVSGNCPNKMDKAYNSFGSPSRRDRPSYGGYGSPGRSDRPGYNNYSSPSRSGGRPDYYSGSGGYRDGGYNRPYSQGYSPQRYNQSGPRYSNQRYPSPRRYDEYRDPRDTRQVQMIDDSRL